MQNPQAQIAISLNYNKLYGWIDFDSISPEYISKNFDKVRRHRVTLVPGLRVTLGG